MVYPQTTSGQNSTHHDGWQKRACYNGGKIPNKARTGTVKDVTYLVQGGDGGLADRKSRFNAVAPLLKVEEEK